VDNVALGQVFSEYFRFPCQSSFHTNFSTIAITYHPGLEQQVSSGRSTQSPTAQIKKKMLQAVRSHDRVPMRWIFFFNSPNPSSRAMALGSNQPLREMNIRNLPEGQRAAGA
jgi:hypothetical protein